MPSFDPRSVLGPEGAIARRLPRHEDRPEQLQMAEAVASAIANSRHLMVEAGTGVGKSFAYLVPAILAAAESGKKVVVSTHTINLQEQLFRKDIPFLAAVLPCEFTSALVKGRSNYLSRRRLNAALTRGAATFHSADQFVDLNALRKWASETLDGSRSDLDFRPLPEVWDAVESDAGNCLGKSCSTHGRCFYYQAFRRTWNSNVLIVNHALYMTDLAIRAAGGSILPEHDVVIMDEAHTLEDVAADHLGLRVAGGAVAKLLNKLFNEKTGKGLLVFHELPDAQKQVRRAFHATDEFFTNAADWLQRQSRPTGRVYKATGLPDVLSEELSRLSTAIHDGAESLEDPEQRIELDAAAARCDALAAGLRTWLKQEMPDSVYWIDVEQKARRRVTLACSPLDVGPILKRDLFDRVPTCILTSATLSVGSPPSFRFFQSRIGLSKCESLRLGSPFDYESQVTLHLPRDMPDPSSDNEEFERRLAPAIRFYVEKTHGKALVLFTSYRSLQQTARTLSPWFASQGITLLIHGEGMPPTKMVEAFKADLDSVIFGTDSFWRGVDVPGQALSNLIITRLPFSVPDNPVLEARLEEIQRRGGNKFFDYQVPEAVIKLKQGFGRLIRTRDDRGIVAILDPRVLTKAYGKQFLDSLPKCKRVVEVMGPGVQ
jgi:ATP-dependent DNA helicase DinG